MIGSLFSLAGKTAVITGGSGGLAMAVSKHFLQAGASLALIDNNLGKLESTAQNLSEWYTDSQQKMKQEVLSSDLSNASSAAAAVAAAASSTGINSLGKQRISSWACDVSDALQVGSTMASIREHHSRPLDILINTAGYCENIPAVDYPALNIKRLIDVNLTGSMIVATEFAKLLMKDKNPGSIALVASMSGSIVNHPQPQAAYNMSKAGVIHLAKSLASEWAPFNIRVNSLSPGYILTPLTKAILEKDPELHTQWTSNVPLMRMAEPDEFAGPLIFMSSAAGSYMTGHDLVVDGGYTIW